MCEIKPTASHFIYSLSLSLLSLFLFLSLLCSAQLSSALNMDKLLFSCVRLSLHSNVFHFIFLYRVRMAKIEPIQLNCSIKCLYYVQCVPTHTHTHTLSEFIYIIWGYVINKACTAHINTMNSDGGGGDVGWDARRCAECLWPGSNSASSSSCFFDCTYNEFDAINLIN